MAITEKKAAFVAAFRQTGNATEAVIVCGLAQKRNSAATIGWRLLRDPDVLNMLRSAEAAAVDEVAIQARDVIKRYVAGAFVDRNEIAQVRRQCCRFCHGEGHRYQRTAPEREIALEAFESRLESWREDNKDVAQLERPPIPTWDEKGGVGFDPRLRPHPECPGCFGEGVVDLYMADSRDLSEAAKMIYAGAKMTRHGIEVSTLDKMASLDRLAQHLGILKPDQTSAEAAVKVYVNCAVEEIGSVLLGQTPVLPGGGARQDLAEPGPGAPSRGPSRHGQEPDDP